MNTTTFSPAANEDARSVFSLLRPAIVLFLFLSLATGLVYPFSITAIAKLAFPYQARGSLIERDGKVVGSALIGQSFSSAKYFWSRPSATAPMPYNAAASGGSNFGPSAEPLKQAVAERVGALRAMDPANVAPIPVDLITSSASGLDPHISRAAADYQAARVARERGVSLEKIGALIERFTEWPLVGVIGEARVNVLQLNLALDAAR